MKRFISLIFFAAVFLCASCTKERDKASDKLSVLLPDGTVISVGDSAAVLDSSQFLKTEREEEYEINTCLEDGKEYYYVYDGLSVSTDGSGIKSLKITSPVYRTVSGAHVGMSLAELTDIYGKGTDRGEFILYKKGNRSVMFYMSDGTVVSIVLK